MRAIARRLILPHAIIAAIIVAAALWFVLYGMKGGDGKETQLAATGECAGSAALAPKLKPLAQGGIAALAINASPRPMPALTFSGSEGPVELSSFKGRIGMLSNFWATWCVPCREEMPALDRLQGIAGNDNFAVVAVNIDTARLERPKAFLQEIGAKNLPLYRLDGQIVFDSAAKRQSGRIADNFPDWPGWL